ncbi:FUSC family protein [Pseudonocardia alaniniphila]|uniref:FUSC family protein n=1 Tax=Pseudonocardia alaniniphila TaxID=75291 RepID=A0ABS9TV41_9PSEU|nr:FUSC family protein [Pseudonocardia alaniniphila]MCH6172366.1 FUSC family protein [Pseudonocardia alaniniphila]
MTSTTHRAALRRAVRAGLAFGPVLQDRARLLRVALGICLATALGLVLGDEIVETLLCVGAFFGGVGSLIPHERHRFVVAWASAAMFTIAASVGAALHSVWPAVYVVLFAGMFASGLLRAVSVGLGVRLLFASIVMLIVAETVPAVATAGEAVGWLGLGAAISAACQFLPPYGPRHGTQRLAVSGLYDALALGAQEKAGGIDQRRSYAAAIRAAWRAVSLVPARRQAHVADLLGLLTEGERIAGELHALRTGEPTLRASAEQLRVVATAVRTAEPPTGPTPPAGPGPLGESVAVARCLASGSPVESARPEHTGVLVDLRASLARTIATVRAQLCWESPVFRHAMRLAVAATLAEWVGRAAGDWGGIGIAGHGFWMCLTAALVLFPDYAETIGRGVARTAGTLVGALVGWGLAQVPTSPLVHAVILCGLLGGYLVFRGSGQLWLIMWIAAWVSYLLGGGSAFTRLVDTVGGAVIALAVFLVWPTWHRDRLPAAFATWAREQGSLLATTATAWVAPGSTDDADLAEQRRATRDARLEFAESAEHALHEPTRHHVAFDDEPLGELLGLIHDVSRHSATLATLAPHDEAEACPAAAGYVTYFDDVMRSVATTAETGVLPAGRVTAPLPQGCGDALADTALATEALAAAVGRFAVERS